MKRRTLALLAALTLLSGLLPAGIAARDPARDGPSAAAFQRLKDLKLGKVATSDKVATAKLATELRGAAGRQTVLVQLKAAPVGAVARAGAVQQRQLSAVKLQQSGFAKRLAKIDAKAKVEARIQRVLNGFVVTTDAKQLRKIAADPDVVAIRVIKDYELALTETVPYVGAKAVQARGFTGRGVRIAVLDTGLDYTHKEFGGAGTVDAYKAAYGTTTADVRNRRITDTFGGKLLFPNARVIDGYDFVGETWAGGADVLEPDPDPIDCSPTVIGCDGGHGTHVADIAAGLKGVAPKASIIAIKVCSSVSTACSGIAMLRGLDFAMDPDGNGNLSDAAHVVNMSIGSDYGQAPEDSISLAVEIMSKAGTIVAIAAGNGGDKPFVTGTSAAAMSAISVAQTSVPSAVLPVMEIVSPAAVAGLYQAQFQPWSVPLTTVKQGPAQYGNGAGGNLNGCAAFPAGSLTGKVVLVDRGACNFSLKISNISQGGGLVGVIGLITDEDPFTGADGGDRPIAIPGFMVHLATADAIREGIAAGGAVIRFDPAKGVPLKGIMTTTSSRGPSMVTHLIKPEIGAPGASVSAEVGTGTGATVFGGTSGAAPMVAGAAALLRQAFPRRSNYEIKAMLVDTAETNILNATRLFGGGLAPITRIGGGELRVNRALATRAAVWEKTTRLPTLSFGFRDYSTDRVTHRKVVTVKNYSNRSITYRIKPIFRFGNDRNNGAVKVTAPATITVPAFAQRDFTATLTVTTAKLRTSKLDSGLAGTDPAALTLLEYDGYINLDNAATTSDNADPLHIPWQILPRKAGDTTGPSAVTFSGGHATATLTNKGVGPSFIDGYSLLGVSPNDPKTPGGDDTADVDLRYVGVQTFFPLPTASASPSSRSSLASTTWDRTTHAVAPAMIEWDIDTTGDGEADFAVMNGALSGPFSVDDARMVTWVVTSRPFDATAFFGVDHGTRTGNLGLLLCGEQLGLTVADVGVTELTTDVFGVDWYNSGTVRDVIEDVIFLPFGERYFANTVDVPGKSSRNIVIDDFGAVGTNPDELGVLLFTDSARGDFRSGAQTRREAIAILAN